MRLQRPSLLQGCRSGRILTSRQAGGPVHSQRTSPTLYPSGSSYIRTVNPRAVKGLEPRQALGGERVPARQLPANVGGAHVAGQLLDRIDEERTHAVVLLLPAAREVRGIDLVGMYREIGHVDMRDGLLIYNCVQDRAHRLLAGRPAPRVETECREAHPCAPARIAVVPT